MSNSRVKHCVNNINFDETIYLRAIIESNINYFYLIFIFLPLILTGYTLNSIYQC